LLKYDLGFAQVKTSGLDIEVPSDFLGAIAERAGLPVEIIQRTTFLETVPFLLQRPDQFNSENCSVLFERPNRAPRRLAMLHQWFRKESMSKVNGCRQCLADYPNASVLLGWGLSVVLSCPIHKLMLESARKNLDGLTWVNENPEAAPDLLGLLDCRSMTAMAEGYVQLPGGLVSAEQWFKLVQTIFQDLNGPLFWGDSERWKWQLRVWKVAGYYPPGPFESLKFDKGCGLLIATAIDLMRKGEIVPTGAAGAMFVGHE